MKAPLEVFLSYAHEDENWKKDLEIQLRSLERKKLITKWHDRDITAGTEWAREIDAHLKSAHIILLLVSPNFIASDYCSSIEVKTAMRRHNAGEACVIPIIVRPSDWENTSFSKLQVLPPDGNPISTSPDQDEAFLKVNQGIREAIDRLKKK